MARKFIKPIKHGLHLNINDPRQSLPAHATVGTVIGYAMDNAEDPIDAYNSVVKQNNDIPSRAHYVFVWISLDGTVISNSPERKVIRVNVSVGDVVKLEGKFYSIEPAHNDNFKLVECLESDADLLM